VGGYSTNTVGEDYEFTVKLHRYLLENDQDYQVKFLPEPVCWTEVPESLGALARQRKRWQRGAIETISKHWKMAVQPRYGCPGIIGMGSSIIIDIVSPVLEILGYFLVPVFWAFELLSTDFLLAFFALSVGTGIALSLASLILAELELSQNSTPKEIMSLGIVAIVENFGYRQLNAIWRLLGTWQHLRKHKGWDINKRVGFKKQPPTS
jgi:cellulose synthase/poly-beta-1,6-N-acetylglucosamine synthase-like glycosyltransferase